MNLQPTSKEISLLKNTYHSAKPYKHVTITNLLGNNDATTILSALQKEQFYEKRNDLYHFYQTNDFKHIKNKELQKLCQLFSSKKFLTFIKEITGITLKGTIDMAGTKYCKGNYLLCHDDQVEERKIAYVYYLNTQKEEAGGAFNIYNRQGNNAGIITKKIAPENDMLLIFEVSPNSFHEVQEILRGTRHAISGWIQ